MSMCTLVSSVRFRLPAKLFAGNSSATATSNEHMYICRVVFYDTFEHSWIYNCIQCEFDELRTNFLILAECQTERKAA